VISGIVLAAGKSQRMRRPKMSLAWGKTTVLGHVLDVLQVAGLEDILVVTGASRQEVERICAASGARTVFNEVYENAEMLVSLQIGISNTNPLSQGALIALGDQPQIQEHTIRMIMRLFHERGAPIIVPSHEGRRGHPWFITRKYWDELLKIERDRSAREFLDNHASDIEYVYPETNTILQDIDTPEEYRSSRP
jgi:molybdenum cofactor cytidylyltransferase